jgi:hypothetical protein
MDGPHRSGPTEEVAGHRTWRPSRGYLVLALAIVAGGLTYAWLSAPTAVPVVATPAALPAAPEPRPASSAPALTAAPSAPVAPPALAASATVPSQQISRMRDPNGDQTPDLSDFVNAGEKPTMGEVIDRLHQAGVHSGLGAFSPPGTRPPLVGLAVPDDFVLPEGYVRHHQTTDDGQNIEAILMFSPDRPPVDAANRPIPIPKDRVVPPELAPPGLPIRRIVIPAPVEPGRPGR